MLGGINGVGAGVCAGLGIIGNGDGVMGDGLIGCGVNPGKGVIGVLEPELLIAFVLVVGNGNKVSKSGILKFGIIENLKEELLKPLLLLCVIQLWGSTILDSLFPFPSVGLYDTITPLVFFLWIS